MALNRWRWFGSSFPSPTGLLRGSIPKTGGMAQDPLPHRIVYCLERKSQRFFVLHFKTIQLHFPINSSQGSMIPLTYSDTTVVLCSRELACNTIRISKLFPFIWCEIDPWSVNNKSGIPAYNSTQERRRVSQASLVLSPLKNGWTEMDSHANMWTDFPSNLNMSRAISRLNTIFDSWTVPSWKRICSPYICSQGSQFDCTFVKTSRVSIVRLSFLLRFSNLWRFPVDGWRKVLM